MGCRRSGSDSRKPNTYRVVGSKGLLHARVRSHFIFRKTVQSCAESTFAKFTVLYPCVSFQSTEFSLFVLCVTFGSVSFCAVLFVFRFLSSTTQFNKSDFLAVRFCSLRSVSLYTCILPSIDRAKRKSALCQRRLSSVELESLR